MSVSQASMRWRLMVTAVNAPAGKVRIQIVRRADVARCRWEPIGTGPPAWARFSGHVVLDPDTPQCLDGGDLSQPDRRFRSVDHLQQHRPVRPSFCGQQLPIHPLARLPGIVMVAVIPLNPLGLGVLIQSGRRDLGQGVERTAQCLPSTPGIGVQKSAGGQAARLYT
jgi:hypothetical protein